MKGVFGIFFSNAKHIIMKTFAGYYNDKEKNRKSASGGAATILSETMIKMGATVYGAIYSEDFYSARFGFTDKTDGLEIFKGSKYAFVEKYILRNGHRVGLFKDISDLLQGGGKVLLIGLGCDIGNMRNYLKIKGISEKNFFSVELICDGVTPSVVQREFVRYMEKKRKSKIIALNLRYKNPLWEPTYIYIKYENQKEEIVRFDYSEFSELFYGYKDSRCFQCKYKGEKKHCGDVIIGDFWGCDEKLSIYNETGVSLIISNSKKGQQMIDNIDRDIYSIKRFFDSDYAIRNQPSFSYSHSKTNEWVELNNMVMKHGPIESIHKKWSELCPERLKNYKMDSIVVWGAGKNFIENFQEIESICPINFVCDNNKNKIGSFICGKEIKSPEVLTKNKEYIVIISVLDPNYRIQIINRLIDMKIIKFDFLENWIKYAKCL